MKILGLLLKGVIVTLLSPLILSFYLLVFVFGIVLYILQEPIHIIRFAFGQQRAYNDPYQLELERRRESGEIKDDIPLPKVVDGEDTEIPTVLTDDETRADK